MEVLPQHLRRPNLKELSQAHSVRPVLTTAQRFHMQLIHRTYAHTRTRSKASHLLMLSISLPRF